MRPRRRARAHTRRARSVRTHGQARRRLPTSAHERSSVQACGGQTLTECQLMREHVGSTEGVRWKGYPSKEMHAAAFRVAKTP